MSLSAVYNNNLRNTVSDDIYRSFNEFIFSSDTKILGKLLHRHNFFQKTMHLPGDIVEIGVFKGSGMATFSKFVDIFCPNSNKKIIGFDIFGKEEGQAVLDNDTATDKAMMNVVYDRVAADDLSFSSVKARLDGMQMAERHILVKGDVEATLPAYLKENPGLRISLLYIDVDIERPTYAALHHLWDRLLPGGIVVFDEFEYHKFSESVGVERFLKERGMPFDLQSTQWVAPTAFMLKKGF
jgi:hypothetical protein